MVGPFTPPATRSDSNEPQPPPSHGGVGLATVTLSTAPMSTGTLTDAGAGTERGQRFAEGTPPGGGEPACDVCPHSLARHDAISSRFCSATLTGALARGCICRGA